MYTIIDRRTTNIDRLAETGERAETEYFSKLRSAPGFSGFYLIADEGGEIYVGITVWESKAHAEAFEATMSHWLEVLVELGHVGLTEDRGEAVVELLPEQ